MSIRSLPVLTVVAVLAGLLVASPAGAQSPPAVLEVTVVDVSGDPVEGLVVEIQQLGTDDAYWTSALTDPDGVATFSDVPTEPTSAYQVTVWDVPDPPGTPYTQEVTLTAGATTTVGVSVQGPPPEGEIQIIALDRRGLPLPGIEGSLSRRDGPPFFFDELHTGDDPVTFSDLPAGTYDVFIGWPGLGFSQTVEVLDDEVTVVTFHLPFPEPNDDFADATPLEPGDGDSGSFIGATLEADEPSHKPLFPPNGSLWYTFTNSTAQLVTLSAEAVLCEADTVLAVYTGGAVDALTLVTANDDAGGDDPCRSEVTFLAAPGTTYRIALAATSFTREASQYVLGLTVAPAPDTDSDGLLDADELVLGTDPTNPDTDGDALPDGTEVAHGTNPLDPDTDGDGLPDGKDVEHVQATIDALGDDAFRSPWHRPLLQLHLELVELSLRADANWPAILVLFLFYARIDGCGSAPDSDDWVVDCDAQLGLRAQVRALAAAIL